MREDLLTGLRSFASAVASGAISPRRGELRPDILVYDDKPNGETRLSYALVRDGEVVAMATLGGAEPFEGKPCFQLNYLVEPAFRGRGLAADISKAAVEEAKNGLGRNRVRKWVVEAVIDADHTASLKVAHKIFFNEPVGPERDLTGSSVYQFVEVIEVDGSSVRGLAPS